jgi:hypothetical protein
VTTPREKASLFLLFAGIVLSFAAIVVSTSDARAGTEYYEAKGQERFDGGLGHAVPKETVSWIVGAAVLAFAGARLVRKR